jgi:23S rRNA (uracil1939-C5)-methyltransferase
MTVHHAKVAPFVEFPCGQPDCMVEVEFFPGSFLQPSAEGEKTLRDLVLKFADSPKRAADLFCGLGTFTYSLNARGFDLPLRDLFRYPLNTKELKLYDFVNLDPPRAGAQVQCEKLAKSKIERVVYVSCNPESFLRDMKILEKGGYVLSALVPVDQFPGSAHWELVALFKRP